MKLILVALSLVVCALLLVSGMSFVREKTVWRFLQFLGAVCLVIVVLTHVAEAIHALPSMEWGMPNSSGHLVSAVLGLTLLSLGFATTLLLRRKNSK
jgi:hypothetical protein